MPPVQQGYYPDGIDFLVNCVMEPRTPVFPGKTQDIWGEENVGEVQVKDKFIPALIYSSTTQRSLMGSEGIAPFFLPSVLDGSEQSATCPGRFTPAEKTSGIH
jgi:hypothetical protein